MRERRLSTSLERDDGGMPTRTARDSEREREIPRVLVVPPHAEWTPGDGVPRSLGEDCGLNASKGGGVDSEGEGL